MTSQGLSFGTYIQWQTSVQMNQGGRVVQRLTTDCRPRCRGVQSVSGAGHRETMLPPLVVNNYCSLMKRGFKSPFCTGRAMVNPEECTFICTRSLCWYTPLGIIEWLTFPRASSRRDMTSKRDIMWMQSTYKEQYCDLYNVK